MNKLILLFILPMALYANSLYAKEECAGKTPINIHQLAHLFVTDEGEYAMTCGTMNGCDIAKPREYGVDPKNICLEGTTMYLNYGMEGYEVIKIEIIELTDHHIKLKFPDFDEIQTFYRPQV